MSDNLRFHNLSNIFKKIGTKKQKMEQKLIFLENKIEQLEKERETKTETDHLNNTVPIIIEQLYVEKIQVDQFDLNNNIGALGIRELAGKLNIGANYNDCKTEDNLDEGMEVKKEKGKEVRSKNNKMKREEGPKYNIRAK